MNELNALTVEAPQDFKIAGRLPRRNWIILPAISLLTIGLIVGSLEVIAKYSFPRSESSISTCFTGGYNSALARPNSVCWEKMPESPLVQYSFNACGHRSLANCGPKPEGTFRIVLIGSSFVFGYQVPYEQTFGVLLQKRLSRLTGRKVEVDNQGLIFGTPLSVARRFGEVLAAKPDMILWAIPPWDVEFASGLNGEHAGRGASNSGTIHHPSLWMRLFGPDSWIDHRRADWRASAVRLLLQHILYQSQSQYIHAKLMQNDSSGFLFKEVSADWTERWKVLSNYAMDLAARSRAAGVPLVLTALPDRAEASLISAGNWPRDIDPFAFGRKVRSAADTSGSAYLDLLPSFRTVPAVEQLYYPVDGHMDGEGCALLARFLADALTGGGRSSLTKYDQGTSGKPSR